MEFIAKEENKIGLLLWLSCFFSLLFLKAGVSNTLLFSALMFSFFKYSAWIHHVKLMPSFFWLPIVFVLFAISSLTWSKVGSSHDVYEAISHLKFVLLIPIFFLTLNRLSNYALENLLRGFYIFLAINVFLTLAAYAASIELPGGASIKDRIFFGELTAIFILWSFLLFLECPQKKKKMLFFWSIVFSVFSIYFIEDGRTGYLLTLLAILYVLFLNREKISNSRYLVLMIIILVIAGNVYGVFFGRAVGDNNVHQATGLSSLGIRSEMIKAGLLAFLDAPVLGHGLGSYRAVANELTGGVYHFWNNPHSYLILLLVEFGIVGILVALAFSYKLVCYGEKSVAKNFFIGFCLLIMFDSIVNSTFFDMHSGYLFALLIALGVVCVSRKIDLIEAFTPKQAS